VNRLTVPGSATVVGVDDYGIQQELGFFGLADVPIGLALLLDLSASIGTQLDVTTSHFVL